LREEERDLNYMIWLETKKRRSQNIFELLIAIAGYYIKDHRIEVKK
jgi:hypothetical protein